MSNKIDDCVEKIVDLIIDDISSRKMLKYAWNKIDKELQEEIRETWRTYVLVELCDSKILKIQII